MKASEMLFTLSELGKKGLSKDARKTIMQIAEVSERLYKNLVKIGDSVEAYKYYLVMKQCELWLDESEGDKS